MNPNDKLKKAFEKLDELESKNNSSQQDLE
jgi:hypothetical protein